MNQEDVTYIYVTWPDRSCTFLTSFDSDEDSDVVDDFWDGHSYIENSLGGMIWSSHRPPEFELAGRPRLAGNVTTW